MSRRLRAMRNRVDRLVHDDRGTTLMELAVGMAIMAIFMSIFTGAILLMTNTANKVEATSISASQPNQAFLRLDKTVRYASAISTPGVSNGDWYVELDSPPTTPGGSDTCTQLRIHPARDGKPQLQQRTWTNADGTDPTWTPIASFIMNGTAAAGSADAPFTVPPASASASTTFQRLRVVLVSGAGTNATATNRAQMTFTALNSDASQPGNAAVCQERGRGGNP